MPDSNDVVRSVGGAGGNASDSTRPNVDGAKKVTDSTDKVDKPDDGNKQITGDNGSDAGQKAGSLVRDNPGGEGIDSLKK